ncbi:hypothetical protein [Burkholderia oklahomensis]|uniref:hypothetical protein n=1 Tax=Burkholderia oklahomensis TaxID=342113 RepID=UPI0005726D7B|nr:hypothetical protein [Burkholderia oklahomensis]AOI44202.1 hypothetical protein WG70_23825 [Burkholderia oklahomensis EO147]KUY60104.1 hypothetical protein WG70_06690 [Burkholderia oklahomensis EO147]QPS37342.1 hypothetical protein I6G57_00100 [Burkholderia oklahomensis]
MSALHREIEVPPHLIVVNAAREYLPGRPDPNGGFKARARITRLDGKPVYKNFLPYDVLEGAIFGEVEDALRDAADRAMQAINAGFPDV